MTNRTEIVLGVLAIAGLATMVYFADRAIEDKAEYAPLGPVVLVNTEESFGTREECLAAAPPDGGPRVCVARVQVLGACATVPPLYGFESQVLTRDCPEGSPSAHRIDVTYLGEDAPPKCWKVKTKLLWACSWKPPVDTGEFHPDPPSPLSTDPMPADQIPMPASPPCPPEVEETGSPPVCKAKP